MGTPMEDAESGQYDSTDPLTQYSKQLALKNAQMQQMNAYKEWKAINNTVFKDNTGIATASITGYGGVVRFSDTEWNAAIDPDYTSKQDADRNLNTKIFVHFAQLFCERYPNWDIHPDADDVFHKVRLVHKNTTYKIINKYPDNEVQLTGAPSEFLDKVQRFSQQHHIPPSVFKVDGERMPLQTFYGWALGIGDVPEFIKE